VIPVYRNQGALRPTYEGIRALFTSGGPLSKHKYEFIFVDDGSDDGSLKELESLHASDSAVKILSFSRNFGQMAAVIAGFRHATGDAVINKAADMQEPVAAVVEMVRRWEEGAEVVLGRRTGREDSLLANILGNAYWAILQRLNPNLPVGSDFFLLGRPAVEAFNTIDESDRFFPVDVLWLGFRPVVVPYHRHRRHSGRSQWSVSRKVKAGIDGILHSSYLPIRLISFIGILISILGLFATLAIIALRIWQGQRYPGWASIACLVLVLNGLTILMLGVIGEYVWRIYNQAKHRPTYIVRRRIG
jgi:dolichol-phosphate mannosyltransferase